MNKILVAMSGGVDSSSAAYLLKHQGFEVCGAHMVLWLPEDPRVRETFRAKESGARRVAEHLDIPFHSFDFTQEFKKYVVDYFKAEYERGRTPNPCSVCNQKVKFSLLLRKAHELGMDGVATGHYVAKVFDETKQAFLLQEGADKKKDQSYFLFLLTQEQLAHALFPLSSYTKDSIRAVALRERFPLYSQSESQEICFIPDTDYSSFLTSTCGLTAERGNIKDTSGRILGHHSGYFNYTIGQRRGLGIGSPHPLYVTRIEKDSNEIIVGTKEEALRKDFQVKDLHWIVDNKKDTSFSTSVRVRYNQKKQKTRITVKGTDGFVVFTEVHEVITPGQAAVFYDGETVLGGGWIA